MSERGDGPASKALQSWMRRIEDRVATLERRKTQGAIQVDSLTINDAIRFLGNAEDACYDNAVQIVRPTAVVTLTTTLQDTGAELTITRPGRYLVISTHEFILQLNATGWLSGVITATGHVSQVGAPAFVDTVNLLATSGFTSVAWSIIEWRAAGTVRQQAQKTGASTSYHAPFGAALAAIWLGQV